MNFFTTNSELLLQFSELIGEGVASFLETLNVEASRPVRENVDGTMVVVMLEVVIDTFRGWFGACLFTCACSDTVKRQRE